MLLKREAGYFVYFILILILKIIAEIKSDGLQIDDSIGIITYSITVTLFINVFLVVLESIISLIINRDFKFWKYFNVYTSIIVSGFLLLTLLITFLIIPRIDTMLLWTLVFIIGEIIRISYYYWIIKE